MRCWTWHRPEVIHGRRLQRKWKLLKWSDGDQYWLRATDWITFQTFGLIVSDCADDDTVISSRCDSHPALEKRSRCCKKPLMRIQEVPFNQSLDLKMNPSVHPIQSNNTERSRFNSLNCEVLITHIFRHGCRASSNIFLRPRAWFIWEALQQCAAIITLKAWWNLKDKASDTRSFPFCQLTRPKPTMNWSTKSVISSVMTLSAIKLHWCPKVIKNHPVCQNRVGNIRPCKPLKCWNFTFHYVATLHVFRFNFLAWLGVSTETPLLGLGQDSISSYLVLLPRKRLDNVSTSHQKYLVVSHLQMLKHSLEQWSLAWQPARLGVAPSTFSPPPNMKVT